MISIPLRNIKGEVVAHALIDDVDAPLAEYRWHMTPEQYVVRTVGEHRLNLHRVILGLSRGDGRLGDHINGNPLDNRRSNLRIAEPKTNSQNRKSHRGSSSKHRGVSWVTRAGKWRAQAHVDGVDYFLGQFADEERAAEVAAAFRADKMPGSREALGHV